MTTNGDRSDRESSYVLAISTSAYVASEAQRVVSEVLDSAELRAPREQSFHYGTSEGIDPHFVSLNANDRIEGPLAAAIAPVEMPDEGIAFIDPVSIIVCGVAIEIGRSAARDATAEGGQYLYHGLKRLARSAWRVVSRDRVDRPDRESRSHEADLERGGGAKLRQLFDSLGLLYADERIQGTPMFIRVLNPDLMFLAEQDLPPEAVQEAARLCLDEERAQQVQRPLRWGWVSVGWRELPPDWSQPRGLRGLRHHLGAVAEERRKLPK